MSIERGRLNYKPEEMSMMFSCLSIWIDSKLVTLFVVFDLLRSSILNKDLLLQVNPYKTLKSSTNEVYLPLHLFDIITSLNPERFKRSVMKLTVKIKITLVLPGKSWTK